MNCRSIKIVHPDITFHEIVCGVYYRNSCSYCKYNKTTCHIYRHYKL